MTKEDVLAKLESLRRAVSERALDSCRGLFCEHLATHGLIPTPLDFMEDGERGITVSWKNGEKYFECLFPADSDPYFYYSQGKQYGILLSPGLLSMAIEWVAGISRGNP